MQIPDQSGSVRRPRGMFSSRVDEKGRLKLPADIHRYLMESGATQVFITSFDGRTARIYPIPAWEEAERLLERQGEDANDGEDLLYKAQYYGADAEIDAQARLLMPPVLRRSMAVENQPVQMAFFRAHIEVFSQEVHDQKMGRAETNGDDKLRKFQNLGLQ